MSRPHPPRLSHVPDGEAPSPVARMFRAAHELPDEDLPKLMWRIRASQRRRAQRPRLVLRMVVVVGGVFCMGGLVGAYWGRRQSVPPAPPSQTAPSPRKNPAPARAPEAPARQPEPAPAPPAPASAEAIPEPAKSGAPPRTRIRPRVAMNQPVFVAEPPPPPAQPSPLAVEQALIAEVLEALRDSHKPQVALGLLGEHADRFPNGVLQSEAGWLRVEALLTLGRKDEALSVLERSPVAAAPNRDEQLVLRGELRSTNLRWLEAEEDFDEVLDRHGDTLAPARTRGLQERALWGRATARSRLGDEAGARADLALYLRLFPAGRFAGMADKLLQLAP